MTLTVPHNKTQQEAIAIVDRNADAIFSAAAGGYVEIVDPTHEWHGSAMTFSFVGSVGFISLPVTGRVEVDDVNVIVNCELPPMAKNFIGDEKVAASIEKKLRAFL